MFDRLLTILPTLLLNQISVSGDPSLMRCVCADRDHVRTNGACMESRHIAKAPPGEGCPRCGGYVYAAEQMLARGRVRSHSILTKIY